MQPRSSFRDLARDAEKENVNELAENFKEMFQNADEEDTQEVEEDAQEPSKGEDR